MKRNIYYLMLTMVCLALLSGCGKLSSINSADRNSNQTDVKPSDEQQAASFQAEVIDAGDSLLGTPDKESNEYRSSDKITVGINNTVIEESYPAQITASAIEVTGHNILIDGYLALIDDIYQMDSGLNSDIEMIALDTTGWINLTDIEKEIIFTRLKETYGMEIKEGTFDELAEQRIIDKDNLNFPNGVHIIIYNMKYDEKRSEMTCSFEKWRSGDGAIGADNVTAKFKDGKWNIKKGDMRVY